MSSLALKVSKLSLVRLCDTAETRWDKLNRLHTGRSRLTKINAWRATRDTEVQLCMTLEVLYFPNLGTHESDQIKDMYIRSQRHQLASRCAIYLYFQRTRIQQEIVIHGRQ